MTSCYSSTKLLGTIIKTKYVAWDYTFLPIKAFTANNKIYCDYVKDVKESFKLFDTVKL